MSESNLNRGPRSDGAFTGPLDQETFRALLFNSFVHQQNRLHMSRREGERLAAIAETCRAVAQCCDLRAALNLVAARALEITGSTGAAIAIGAQEQMTCWAMSGPTAPPLGTPLPLDSGLSGECLRSRRTLRCDDTESDPRVNREACAHLGGVGSMLLVPLLRRNAAIGVLEVFSTRPRAFDDTEEHVLELLAVIASAALADIAGNEAATRVSRSPAASVRIASSPISPA
jgi:GAF domain-containing protein